MTTKFSKILTTLLFFVGLFFTSICFVDTWRSVFFLSSHYQMLKFILAFLIPCVVTIITYAYQKSFLIIGKCTFAVMILYVICFVIDRFTINWIANLGDFMVIFHLGYGLISVCSVLITAIIIKWFTKNVSNNFDKFYNLFFDGFLVMFVFIFIMIYFVIRDYNSVNSDYVVNFIPFKGEFSQLKNTIKLGLFQHTIIIRSVGNVLFYSGMALLVIRFVPKHKTELGIFIPIIISVLSETFQYVFTCGDCDVDDVITNTIGAIIGVAFYNLAIKPIHK